MTDKHMVDRNNNTDSHNKASMKNSTYIQSDLEQTNTTTENAPSSDLFRLPERLFSTKSRVHGGLIKLPWYRKFSIRNAYGQLILLIFIPIAMLATIGAVIVLNETRLSQNSLQRNNADAVILRYTPAAHLITPLLSEMDQIKNVEAILQPMLSEPHVRRVALVDAQQRVRIRLGNNADSDWPTFAINREIFGPLHNSSTIGNVYGRRVGYTADGPIWLLVEMDNQPLTIANLRVWVSLGAVSLITVLLLLLCLNIYARRWISPIYELRIHLNHLNIENLNKPIHIKSSGELRMLQKDIVRLTRRVHDSIVEMEDSMAQQEADIQGNLDALEMQNIEFRKTRDQAISTSQAKSAFLANISHELRTPLNSIDGFINLLQRRGNLTGEPLLFVQTIQKSSAHLLALVNDVLDFSKIEAGKLALEHMPFNLQDAVFDVLDMLSPLASEKNLRMAVFYYDDVPEHVIGDELRFKQILTNLVNNAIKFTHEGEVIVRVTVDDNELMPNLAPQHEMIHVSIQDSGIGLGTIDPAHLFHSFGQADASVTRQFGGTGLGLSIAKQLAKMMGGDIGAHDNQELQHRQTSNTNTTIKGATFWFNIQLALNPQKQGATAFTTEIRLPEATEVLAFIQHKASLNALRGYLARLDISLHSVDSLPELLGRLSEQQHLPKAKTQWVIVEADKNTDALLREIRLRFAGDVALFGYQVALNTTLLDQYQAKALLEPIKPQQLTQMLMKCTKTCEEEPELNFHHLHVLAVDDHAPNLMVLEALMSDLGVHVTTANSGYKAVELFSERYKAGMPAYDLIFMDLQMPHLSGQQTVQKLRTLEREWHVTQNTPIIALTAHALKDEKDILLTQDFNDYASKPIQYSTLTHLLEKWSLRGMTLSQRAVNAMEDKSTAEAYPLLTPLTPAEIKQPELFNWAECIQLAGGKPKLAHELILMLMDSLPEEQALLIQAQDAEQLDVMSRQIHRLYGGTKYTGVPRLRTATGKLDKLLSDYFALPYDNTSPQYTLHTLIMTEINLSIEELLKVMQATADLRTELSTMPEA